MKVLLYNLDQIDDCHIESIVVMTAYKKDWVFIRRELSRAWEIPSVKCRSDFSDEENVEMMLRREVGAKAFELKTICIFDLVEDDKHTYGKLMYANVTQFSGLISPNISMRVLAEKLPDELTYPELHSVLFGAVIDQNEGMYQ